MNATAMPLPQPKRFTTKGVHVGRLKEMLHNTPQGQHTMGWYIHPPCTSPTALLATPVALILTGRSLEDYSPAQMVVDLQAGSIDGYCVGNLGTSGAIEGVGFTVATDLRFSRTPRKSSRRQEDWAAYPTLTLRWLKPPRGLLSAG